MKNLLLLVLAVLTFNSAISQATVGSQLNQLLNEGAPSSLQVVVTFHGDDAPTADNVNLLNNLGITQGLTLSELPIAGVIATPVQINALINDNSVRSVFLNYQLDAENHQATEITGVKRVRSDAVITAQNGGLPLSGKGIGVVVNDSGVDGTHPDLKFGENLVQNVLAVANLNAYSGILPYTPVEDVINTDATGGHGTHVAGTVGGTGMASQGLYEGVAPGADLIGYGAGAGLFLLDVLSAFDYAITKQFQYGIRVITNSWGTTSQVGQPFDPNDPINVATKRCTDRNIVVVFSAGNSGSSSSTITGNYKKAPWVICVAAGDKMGELTDFSSRGTAGVGGTVNVGGQTFTWEDRPTITSPGKTIISTRAISPIGVLNTDTDIDLIPPAYLPYYTNLDGTSMAAPHVAGIVALMLEADPTLNPYEVKEIIQQTATNIPGREAWEVGAGYVNAHAAVNVVLGNGNGDYGSTTNYNRSFNANVITSSTVEDFTVDYTPGSSDQITFDVAPGTTAIEAKTKVTGVLGETGNLLNLVLYSPSGDRYSAGIPVTFTLSTGRGVAVANPEPGEWTLSIEGYQDVSAPETVNGTITQTEIAEISGLDDVAGTSTESSVRLAISRRLMDGRAGGFEPASNLTRMELAEYLMMGQGVRQYLATDGSLQFPSMTGYESLVAESVMATGAALKDMSLNQAALLLPATNGFNPQGTVTRAELAYTMALGLGLQDYALSLSGSVTVNVDGEEIEVEDNDDIPEALRGYVQAALNLGLINVSYSLTQEPFGLGFTIHAHFNPNNTVTREEYAVIATRTFSAYQNPPALGFAAPQDNGADFFAELTVYPNPASDLISVNTQMIERETRGQVQLINTSGQVLYSSQQQLIPGGNIELDVTQYPRGIYFLQVSVPNQTPITERVLLK